jgi:hypothetical protein
MIIKCVLLLLVQYCPDTAHLRLGIMPQHAATIACAQAKLINYIKSSFKVLVQWFNYFLKKVVRYILQEMDPNFAMTIFMPD